MSTRYIVFERPIGSLCWTMAHREPRTVNGYKLPSMPGQFTTLVSARAFAKQVEKTHRGCLHGKPNQTAMKSYIATITLPK